jgi:glycosyltransferase involved in cell wall biosynthesis
MSGRAQPSVSVVIPTYRRSRELAACLASLSALDYPLDRLEVIVVDDGGGVSFDPELRDRLELTVVEPGAMRTARRGPAAARNLGAERAAGELLAFTDDDCLPAPDWLRVLVDRYVQTPGHAVGGRTVNLPPRDAYARASQVILDCVYAFYNADTSDARFLASNNLVLPRERFLHLGGFDSGFRCPGGEDRDLCDRWVHHGYGMTYAREALVYHARSDDLPSFARQYFGYGRGAYRYHRARAKRGSGPMRAELGFYRMLARTAHRPVRAAGAVDGALLLALLGMWQVANTLGFAWEGVRSLALDREAGSVQLQAEAIEPEAPAREYVDAAAR